MRNNQITKTTKRLIELFLIHTFLLIPRSQPNTDDHQVLIEVSTDDLTAEESQMPIDEV